MKFIKRTVKSTYKNIRKISDEQFYEKRIKSKLKTLDVIPKLSRSQKQQINELYGKYGFRVKEYWHRYYYAKTGEFNPFYIPESLFHTVIKKHFNNFSFAPAWKDKAYFDLLLERANMPETLVRNINGIFYDNQYNLISDLKAKEILYNENEIVVKPTLDNGGGNNVRKYSQVSDMDNIFEKYNKNYIIQRVVRQHQILSKINHSSVNTIRVTSCFINNKVHILAPFLRIGSEGAFADNTGTDRVLVGLDGNGKLSDFGYNLKEEKVSRHPNGNEFANIIVPSFKDIISTVKQSHPIFAHFGLVFWDFTIDENARPILIEWNLMNPNIGILQLIHGPLFGEITEEILESISDKKTLYL